MLAVMRDIMCNHLNAGIRFVCFTSQHIPYGGQIESLCRTLYGEVVNLNLNAFLSCFQHLTPATKAIW